MRSYQKGPIPISGRYAYIVVDSTRFDSIRFDSIRFEQVSTPVRVCVHCGIRRRSRSPASARVAIVSFGQATSTWARRDYSRRRWNRRACRCGRVHPMAVEARLELDGCGRSARIIATASGVLRLRRARGAAHRPAGVQGLGSGATCRGVMGRRLPPAPAHRCLGLPGFVRRF